VAEAFLARDIDLDVGTYSFTAEFFAGRLATELACVIATA